jgi:cell division protein FtsW
MKKHFDYFLFFLVCGLVGFSALFFFCLSTPASLQRFGNSYYYFVHQILFGILPAIIVGIIAYKTPLDFFKKMAPILVLLNIVAMFMVFLPKIGIKIAGASRWVGIGSFSIQPSEFLKITAILYLSAWIASKLSEINAPDWKSLAKKSYHNIIYIFIPFAIFLGLISIALFFQKDASTLGIISITLLVVYFSAKTPLWHTLLIIVIGLTALLLMVKFEPYRLDRWLIFMNPDQDPLGKGFQLKQSIISLGSGGFWGRGLGMSTQKFGYLPQAMADSIFAIIGEELGIIGCVILIFAFILLFWVGIKIYNNSHDKFAKLTAIGIVFWISLQAFINMASVAGIFPLAGIPLPFFSYGGSHLMVELIGMGLLLNISKNT